MSRKCHVPGFWSDYRVNWQVWAYQIAVLIKESCKTKEKNTRQGKN